MYARGVGLAHVGQKRTNNEDSWLADDQLGFYAVADGVGGSHGGEVASQVAIEAAASEVRSERDLLTRVAAGAAEPKEAHVVVERAIRAATQAVHARAQEAGSPPNMGCTLTMLLVAGNRGIMAHAGDSRLYVCRNGELHQLSLDHSFAAELARQGAIEEAAIKKHPYSNVLTQVVGRLDLEPDVVRFELLPGDRVLLCSDGFSNYVTDEAWLAGKLSEEDLDGIPNELVQFANDAGGGDNITALAVGIEATPSGEQLALAAAVREKHQALGSSFLCERLSLARQALFISHCALRSHAAGEVVLDRGAQLAGVGLVVGGTLEVRAGPGMKPVGVLEPGDTFGLSSLVSPRTARATLVATDAARTLFLTPAALQTLNRIRPRLGAILLRRVARVLAEGLDARPLDPAEAPPSLVP